MWQIAISKWGKDWYHYPKNRKSVRFCQNTAIKNSWKQDTSCFSSDWEQHLHLHCLKVCLKVLIQRSGPQDPFFLFCNGVGSNLRFLRTCVPIWGSLILDSHDDSDIADAGNFMYPSHYGTQAGSVQSDPAKAPDFRPWSPRFQTLKSSDYAGIRFNI